MSQEVMERKDRATLNDQQPTRDADRNAQAPRERRRSSLFVVLVVIVIVLLVAGGFTLLQRRSQYEALAKNTETLAIPTVSVVHPIAEADAEDLVLPSTLQAYVESPIYARTNGYLKKWYHDIGSRVRKANCWRTSILRKSRSNWNNRAQNWVPRKRIRIFRKLPRRAIEGLLQVGQRFETGSRQCHRRPGRQARQHAIGRSQCAAIAGIGIVPAHLRAVQRSHHAAQRGYRKFNQCRKWRLGAAIVLFGADRSDSRVRERAGKLCAVYSQGTGSLPGTGAISRTEISWAKWCAPPMPLT